MKLKYVDYYEKGVSRVVNGVPVIENGKVVRDVKPMFLYAVTDATPEELVQYKRFKRDNPEGADYYRESENGIPLWHNPEFVGMNADISTYKDKEGKTRFRVNKAIQGALEGMRKAFPSLGDKLDEQLFAILYSGAPADLNKLGTTAPAQDTENDKIVDTTEGAEEGSDSDDTSY